MSEPVLHWEPAVGNKPTWKIVDPFGRNGPGSIKPMTLAELAMYELSWTLRRKPEWQRKAADPEIRGKWRREALEQVAAAGSDGATRKNGGLLSEKMIDYVLAELNGYAKIADSEKGIERGCFDAIWHSVRLVPSSASEKRCKRPRRCPKRQERLAPGIKRASVGPRPPFAVLRRVRPHPRVSPRKAPHLFKLSSSTGPAP
ncbi:hypothetical protein B0H17DRAFT_117735 [Mycena rosella]|uniref:DUF4246 domain-containing protein n=1 Tax=Mycena rosella TaxID=1033263 RepID=A0AAD7AWZ8_MYCRO|nr:hypothetical protein B0H17DRAFT_117735 [Mycena rosella]